MPDFTFTDEATSDTIVRSYGQMLNVADALGYDSDTLSPMTEELWAEIGIDYMELLFPTDRAV